MRVSNNLKPKSSKINQILKTARELFFRYGIKRVSVEEICRTASVSKMTFYKYFKNKIDLVKTLMDKIYEQAMTEYHQIMAEPIPYSKKIEKTIQWKLQWQKEISQEFIKDFLFSENQDLYQFYQQKRKIILKKLLVDYQEAQKKGYIRKDIKPEFILYIINKLTDLYDDNVLLNMYDSPAELTREVLNFFFYGILEK